MTRAAAATQRMSLSDRRRRQFNPPISHMGAHQVGPWFGRSWVSWSLHVNEGQCYATPHLHAAHTPSEDGTEPWLTWAPERQITTPLFSRWRLSTQELQPLWRLT